MLVKLIEFRRSGHAKSNQFVLINVPHISAIEPVGEDTSLIYLDGGSLSYRVQGAPHELFSKMAGDY